MRIYYLNLYHFFDAVITFDDSGERKPSGGQGAGNVLSKITGWLAAIFIGLAIWSKSEEFW